MANVILNIVCINIPRDAQRRCWSLRDDAVIGPTTAEGNPRMLHQLKSQSPGRPLTSTKLTSANLFIYAYIMHNFPF